MKRASAEGPRILVVDGDGTRRARTSAQLRATGYTVSEAANVAEALRELAARPSRALVLACRVPDGTALDVVASLPPRAPRPFVVVHGDWTSGCEAHRPHGVDAYLHNRRLEAELLRLLAAAAPVRVEAEVPLVRTGEHVMHIYDGRPALFGILAAYFAAGLAAGKRCLLVCEDERFADEARAHFERSAIDVEREERARALCLVGLEESYFIAGRFAPAALVEFMGDLVSSARDEGFTGMRAAGEGSWLRETPEDLDAWFHYEEAVTAHLARHEIDGLCLYSRERFDARSLVTALDRHPLYLDGRTVRPNAFFRGSLPSCSAVAAAAAATDPDRDLRAKLAAIHQLERSA